MSNEKLVTAISEIDEGLSCIIEKCDISKLNATEKKKLEALLARWFTQNKIISRGLLNEESYEKHCGMRTRAHDAIFRLLMKTLTEPLHERWKDYTDEEIAIIHELYCNKCKYRGTFAKRRSCDYMVITGERNSCRPEVCTHFEVGKIVRENKPKLSKSKDDAERVADDYFACTDRPIYKNGGGR